VDLVVPGAVGSDLVRRAEEDALGIKQIQHRAPRDRHLEWRKARQERLVGLIEGVLLRQAQLPDQTDQV
jgi:hypothetical protein